MNISIITVVLNDAAGLNRTAESVQKQRHGDFEWIVIDGGSKDASLEVLGKYRETNVKAFSEPDNGIYDAMNKGIELASGDYLIFMNAGDHFCDEQVLDEIAGVLNEHKDVDIVLGATDQVVNKCVFYRPPKEISWIKYGLPSFHQSTIFRASLLKKHRYDTRYRLLADYKWLAALCVEGATFAQFRKPIATYYAGGASYSDFLQKYRELRRVKREVLKISRFAAVLGALSATTRTVLLMSVIYRLCSYRWFCGLVSSVPPGDAKSAVTTIFFKLG